MLAALARRTLRPFPTSIQFPRCRPARILQHIERKTCSDYQTNTTLRYLQRRNLSTSAPRRAQYSRFDDGPQNQIKSVSRSQTNVLVVTVAGLGIAYFIAHIEQVPETGRWRFMDVSVEYEAALWESSYTSLSEEYRGKILPPSHIVTQHVHRIVSRILEANNLGTLRGSPRPPVPSREVAHQSSSGFGGDGGQENAPDLWDPDAAGHGASPGTGQKEWNLLVVNDKNTVNAMAAPGTIVVFTGILPVAKDEQGLAAILSHEVGHVVARHSAESYSYMKLLIFAAYLAEVVGFSGMGDLLATLLLQLPHSRKQEYEADQIGLRLSAKACFDPTAAPEMFTRLGALEKGAGGWTPTFLRTHPLSEARVKRLQGLLPDAFALQASACGGTADFLGAFGEAVGLEQRARSSWDS